MIDEIQEKIAHLRGLYAFHEDHQDIIINLLCEHENAIDFLIEMREKIDQYFGPKRVVLDIDIYVPDSLWAFVVFYETDEPAREAFEMLSRFEEEWLHDATLLCSLTIIVDIWFA